jgi:subtilisin family serine protease
MKSIVVGLCVCMLVIVTAVPAVSIIENDQSILYEFQKGIPSRGTLENVGKIAPLQSDTDVVPGEFIIKFKPELTIQSSISSEGIFITGVASIDMLNEKYHVFNGERVFGSFSHLARDNHELYNVFNFHVPEEANIHSIVHDYSSDSHVSYAEPNYLIHSCVIPNDTYFNLQYALHNTGQSGGTPDADIDAPEAWDIETGDENIVIAVVDSGVDWDHPDLVNNIWVNPGEDLNGNGKVDSDDFNDIDDDSNGFVDDLRGWDFVDTTNPVYPGEDGAVRDNNPMDFDGHGTHCSGIASAMTNNNIGIAGVCWDCSIMPVRAGYMSNTGLSAGEMDDIVAAVIYAADNGAHIMSNSWGTYSFSDLLKDTMDYAYAQGVVLVAAAGNFDVNQRIYPAALDNVIAVGATNNKDERVTLSDWGSHFGSWVDVAAPGADIGSTYFNDSYILMSGTSMATPHVSGLVGLMLSKNPGLNQEEVRTILRSTTDPVISEFYVGTGRINAYQALQRDTSPIANLNSILDDAHVSGIVPIIGSASGSTFLNYSIWYGLGSYPETWTELCTSTTPVINDVLTTWDTTSLVEEETYSIRLIIYDTGGLRSKDQAVVIVDNKPDKGWTVQWTFAYGGARTPQSQPIGDIDEDGTNEVFISNSYQAWYDGSCKILSYSEAQDTYIEEHSLTIDSLNYWRHPFGVTVIDLDDDGDLEFCVAWGDTYADGIYAYDWDGTTLTQLDYYNGIGFDFSYSLSACDYDDDGDVELVCANDPHWYSSTKHVTALGWDNVNDEFVEEAFWTLPGHIDKGCWETVSGDTDNDGKTEVIATISDWDSAQTAGTWALNWNKSAEKWEHELVSNNYPTDAPVGVSVGDLNRNGIPEIAVGNGNWNGENDAKVWLYEWNGTSYQEVWYQEYPDEHDVYFAIDIGDADNDGINELCVGTDIVHIYQWDGSDYTEEATLTESRHRLCDLHIGDCDSDGLNEIKTGQRSTYPPGNIGSEFIYKFIGRLPYTDFCWTPQNPGPNQPIAFDASASYDPDGTIILYEWDWDNDGVYDEAHPSPTATHTWNTLGSYPVRLRITDNDNFTGILIKTLIVSGAVNFTIDITGGLGVKAAIMNIGTLNATNIQWKYTLTGGIILLGKTKSGTVTSLATGASTTVKDAPIIGFGKTTIKLEVTCAEGGSATQSKTGKVFLFFVFGVK